jgi:hypothetical protein
MRHHVLTHWLCRPCDVEGRDESPEPECWNCGGTVVVTARPTVPITGAPAGGTSTNPPTNTAA